MAGRSLDPDEQALWSKVMATVRPFRSVPHPPFEPIAAPAKPAGKAAKAAKVATRAAVVQVVASPPARPGPGTTLDGGWDRRLSKGIVYPDASLDLHGHTLASAYQLLDQGLERSIARGDRVLLLVTGKPPRPESERPHARGAIRAAIADWLAASRHASAIAAVRNAHPRHGGTGALYIVFRRARG